MNEYELERLLRSLSEAVKYWFFIHNPDFDFSKSHDQDIFEYSDEIKRTLRKLLRNRYGDFMKPFILAYFLRFFRKDEFYNIEEFLSEVERHNYCVYLLAGKQADTNRAEFSRTINKFLRQDKQHNQVIKMIKDKTDVWLNWGNIFNHIHRSRANNKRFYDWNGSKYTFWEWEQFLKGESEAILKDYSKAETYLIFSDNGNYYGDASYAEIRKARKKDSILKLIYSLGNISIYSKGRNPNPFPKIKEQMLKGSHSDRDIAKSFNSWTDNAILQQGLKILSFIEQRWRIESYNDLPASELDQKRNQLLLDGVDKYL